VIYAAIVPGCGVPGNIQMVRDEFAVIGWRAIPLASNLICLFEFQYKPNRRRPERRGCTFGLTPRESVIAAFSCFQTVAAGAEIIVLYVHHHYGGVLGGEGAVN
jgi:hypothetical protein